MHSTFQAVSEHDVRPGDLIEAKGVPGAPTRRGVIEEVIGEGVHRHYRVQWDEEHESLFFPGQHGGSHLVRRAQDDAPSHGGLPEPPGQNY